jgi:cell division protein FtsL
MNFGFVRRHWYSLTAGVIVIVLAFGLYRSALEAEARRAEVRSLQAQIAAIRAENQVLASEAAMLGNPRRIEQLAVEKLGMRPAAPRQRPAEGVAP